jgi:hypothetical protein
MGSQVCPSSRDGVSSGPPTWATVGNGPRQQWRRTPGSRYHALGERVWACMKQEQTAPRLLLGPFAFPYLCAAFPYIGPSGDCLCVDVGHCPYCIRGVAEDSVFASGATKFPSLMTGLCGFRFPAVQELSPCDHRVGLCGSCPTP